MKTPISVELWKDPNGILVPSKGTATTPYRSIENYELYLDYGDDSDEVLDTSKNIVSHTKTDIDNGKGTMHVIKYSTGFVRYGYEAHEEREKPGHKGWWSSNSEAVHEVTGEWFINVVIKKFNAAWLSLGVEDAKSLVSEGYELIHAPTNFSYYSGAWVIVKSEDVQFFE